MSETESSGICPMCDRTFPLKTLESHVNKCIFLSEKSNNGPKRMCGETSSEALLFSACKKAKTQGNTQDKQEKDVSFQSSVPLAEQMRPTTLKDFIGQNQVLGENKILRSLLQQQDIPSMILWGPPGCGKTTLAHIINKMIQENTSNQTRFVKLSAVTAGVNELKEIVKVAKNELQLFKRRTILFMDEIHRFNKLQQDSFLPHVESGILTLIGATTENPSFSLNSALLSRCRVVVLEKLKTKDLLKILRRAAEKLGCLVIDSDNVDEDSSSEESDQDIAEDNESSPPVVEDGEHKFTIEEDLLIWLAKISDGDARIALNSLHIALQYQKDEGNRDNKITLDDIKNGIKRSHLLYDRKGDQHYNTISALHKSIRASDDNATLYWLTRMMQGGEDPLFIARRLVRAASEDIGLADPSALSIAVSAMQGCQLIGMPECDVLLAQAAVYLARAPKSREMDRALGNAKMCIANHEGPLPEVPLHLRNAPTKLMRELNYGKGYNGRHKSESGLSYMPEGMEGTDFFTS
ncbi:ATPase WRNIP1 [Nilaparvata lugens]|uniref:ATPase WRNIP1 n=1 Tax=Nilaparvata lugens TaxID=108931 RepID=UPI000B998E66|nr:ATPase WRNIP1 [Nilaparvata lugens]